MEDFINAWHQVNLWLLICSSIVGAITPFIIPSCYKWWKLSKIRALNRYLKYGTNPIIQHWLIPCCILSAALFCITYFYFDLSNYWILSLLIIICIPIINWLHIWTLQKDKKGLVGILSDQIETVKEISSSRPQKSDVYFATHVNSKGEAISYEKRTIKGSDDIINERENIVDYYINLKNKIEDIEKNNKNLNHNLFIVDYKGEKMHICKFMSDIAYSKERLLEHVEKVSKKMSDDHSINFIGDKVGVSSYTLEKGQLSLNIYLTDHFTFKVFKSIFFDTDLKEIFQTIIRRTNIANSTEKPLLIESLKFLLSSFGIDIIIHGKTGKGKKAMLVAVRSGNIERKGNCKLHVPVNESFSRTDINDNGKFDPTLCVIRGIEEELGIPRSLIEKAKIVFHDFALVCDEGEIGLGCYVDFSDVMPIEQLRLYPGQDKYMEIKDILIVPYPPFYWNPDKYPNFFYKKTYNDIFCTPWESFTTLLYQRCIIRNSNINFYWEIPFTFILVILINWRLFFIFEDNYTRGTLYSFIIQNAFSISFSIFVKFCCWIGRTFKSYKYSLFKPLIAQWGPDVAVLQATATNIYIEDNTSNVERNPVASHMIFGTNDAPCGNLYDFTLEEAPICCVRREIARNNAESPISYYQLKQRKESDKKNNLFFSLLPFYKEGDDFSIYFEVTFEDRNKNFHFTKVLKEDEVPILEFSETFTKDSIDSYSNCFGIDKKKLENINIAHLPKAFQNKYRPLDLFYYQNNYYWSVIERNNNNFTLSEGTIVRLSSKTDFYKEYIENLEDNKVFHITGKQEQITDFLVKFISNKINLSRISPLDIYILQLALIREGDGSEGIVLAEKKKPLFRKIIKFKK